MVSFKKLHPHLKQSYTSGGWLKLEKLKELTNLDGVSCTLELWLTKLCRYTCIGGRTQLNIIIIWQRDLWLHCPNNHSSIKHTHLAKAPHKLDFSNRWHWTSFIGHLVTDTWHLRPLANIQKPRLQAIFWICSSHNSEYRNFSNYTLVSNKTVLQNIPWWTDPTKSISAGNSIIQIIPCSI